MILLRSLVYGTTVVLAPPPFDAGRIVELLNQTGATLISLVPTMLNRMLDAGLRNPQTLRCALLGGAPVSAHLTARAKEAGVPVAQTYGLTEACSQVTVSEIGKPETAGRPLEGVQVAFGADGEILVSGPTVAPEFLTDDGYLHTGDIGEFTADGLKVLGRKREIIVTGGENVAPAEVEAILVDHPAVLRLAFSARK